MARRTFVMKDGKPQIKATVEVEQENDRISLVPLGSMEDQIFRSDKMGFIQRETCAFIREYIPGEYDGLSLPKDLDLSEITHTFVIIAMDDSNGESGEEHVLGHLEPIGDTYKIIVFDMEKNKAMNARIPLLPEQVEIIRMDIEKGAK